MLKIIQIHIQLIWRAKVHLIKTKNFKGENIQQKVLRCQQIQTQKLKTHSEKRKAFTQQTTKFFQLPDSAAIVCVYGTMFENSTNYIDKALL